MPRLTKPIFGPASPVEVTHKMERRQYLRLTDVDAIAVVAALDTGRKGVDIAREFQCSPAQVSFLNTGRAFKHLRLRPPGRPPIPPLALAERKKILAEICRAHYLYGKSPSQNTSQQAVYHGRKHRGGFQTSPARRVRVLEAIRTCETLIARVKASVSPPDSVTGCQRYDGPKPGKIGPKCPAYLGEATIDAHRVLLMLAGRSIRPFERLTFTCGNRSCCNLDHCVSRRKKAAHYGSA